MRVLIASLAVTGACWAGGCASSFHENHYFRATDDAGRAVNYYRVSVSGRTLLSSSRYLSGYFDDRAVDAYFNEYKQPENARLIPAADPSAAGGAGAAAPAVEPLSESLGGKRLVLILSSNSDDIATGISSLASSNEVAETLTAVVSRGRRESADSAAAAADFANARAKALADKGTATFTAIGEGVDRAATRAELAGYAAELASFLSNGAAVQFNSLEEARAWLAQHPDLLSGGRP